jgi:hypothetical protein
VGPLAAVKALVMPDAAADERYAHLALVAGLPRVRFYAGELPWSLCSERRRRRHQHRPGRRHLNLEPWSRPIIGVLRRNPANTYPLGPCAWIHRPIAGHACKYQSQSWGNCETKRPGGHPGTSVPPAFPAFRAPRLLSCGVRVAHCVLFKHPP